MKVHTTNYINTFIVIADDCPVNCGDVPPLKGESKSIANLQFELIRENPYKYTSDEVLFRVFAVRNNLDKGELEAARDQFFSKGQACFRASPLTKRYGWGVHFDSEGKMAIYGSETDEYEKFINDKSLKIVKAMRTSK